MSSTVYAKIKQDSSDLTKYATTFYAKSDCTGTATSGLFVFAPKCTATGFSANEGSPYARLAFAVPPASNSGLLRFGLFALLASVIALIF